MKKRRAACMVLALLLPVLLGGCLKKMDVTGNWVGFVLWSIGDSFEGETTTIRLELLQDRRDVTGRILVDASFMHLDLPIAIGEGSNNYVTIEAAGAVPGSGTTHAIFLSVEGLVTDRSIDGSGTMTVDGIPHSFTWQAQRST